MNKIEEELNDLRDKVDTLESINLSYISDGGMVKMISWGKDYKSWTTDKKLEFAEALASAMNEAAEVMQNERNIALEEAVRLQKQLETSQEGADIIRNTNIKAITDFNSEKQLMAKRIKDLESQVRKLEIELGVKEHLGR